MNHPIQRLFATIGDPSRFRVLHVLLEGDFCVSEIAERVGLSQSCTTRHLQVLQREGIAVRTRSGKKVIFRAADGPPELSRLIEWALIKQHPPGSGPLAGSVESSRKRRGRALAARSATSAAETAKHPSGIEAPRGTQEPPTGEALPARDDDRSRPATFEAPASEPKPHPSVANSIGASTSTSIANDDPNTPSSPELEDFLL